MSDIDEPADHEPVASLGVGGIAGAVLTGGASRRMGRDKATMPVDGTAMARRVADALVAGGCSTVFAVGGVPARLASLQLRVIRDLAPGQGPLGGIIAALREADGDVLVAACDMPWLDAATVVALGQAGAEDPSADVVMAFSTRPEPLCAIWRRSALPHLDAAFSERVRSVSRAAERLRVIECAVDRMPLTNVNRPGDLPTR